MGDDYPDHQQDGLHPLGNLDYLVVRTLDGETKLSLRPTDMVVGAVAALVDTVEGLRCGALRGMAAAHASRKAVPLGAGAATFDAEAVMERYLADKAAEPQAPPAGRFGTRAPAPAPAPAAAPRSAFGRKGL